MVAAALAAALLAVRAGLASTTALSGLFEGWGQELAALRASSRLAAARRAQAADRWRAAFEAAPLGMAKVSLDGRLEELNPAFCALLGEPERALLGRRLSALVYPDDLNALDALEQAGAPRTREGAKGEVRLVCAGGRLRWCELAASVLRDAHGQAEKVLVNVVDITRHKRSQATLRNLATRDPLSGLANRRWFELQLAHHMRACAEDGPRGALLVMDLDNFKGVNDTLGHQAGDRLVIEVAVTLRRHLRDRDLVARLGGDELAVVLHDGDARAAEAVARKLVLAVRDEVTTERRRRRRGHHVGGRGTPRTPPGAGVPGGPGAVAGGRPPGDRSPGDRRPGGAQGGRRRHVRGQALGPQWLRRGGSAKGPTTPAPAVPWPACRPGRRNWRVPARLSAARLAALALVVARGTSQQQRRQLGGGLDGPGIAHHDPVPGRTFGVEDDGRAPGAHGGELPLPLAAPGPDHEKAGAGKAGQAPSAKPTRAIPPRGPCARRSWAP